MLKSKRSLFLIPGIFTEITNDEIFIGNEGYRP